MGMVVGRLRADALELARADLDHRVPGGVVEMRGAGVGHDLSGAGDCEIGRKLTASVREGEGLV
jgi:hypothetical protein